VPVAPGSGPLENSESAIRFAREVGFPVIVKPSALEEALRLR
jgi:biotin carboxylase